MVNMAFPPDLRSSTTMPPVLVYVPSILDPHATLANATNNTTPPSTDLIAVFMFLLLSACIDTTARPSGSTRNGRLLCSANAVNVTTQRRTYCHKHSSRPPPRKMLRLGGKVC